MSGLTWLKCSVLLLYLLIVSHLTADATELKLLKYFSSSEMPLTPSDVAQQAGEVAKNILSVPAGLLGDQYANYIKSPPPTPLVPNIGVGIARQACRRYADSPDGLPSSVAGAFERVCRPYLDDIGYGQGPKLGKPFNGGQCEGSYLVTATRTTDLSGTSASTFRARGPIGGVRIRQVSGTNYDWEVFAKNIVQGFSTCGTVPDGVARWIRLGGVNSSNGQTSTSITSINPCSNPDCGNPPPVITAPVAPTGPRPTREPYSPAPGTEIDIDVTIGPTGPITFNIGTGPITIDPFGGDGGDGDDGDNPGIDQPGTAPSSGLPPGDIGQPAAPADTTPGGIASGCAPPNSVLVGIKINIMEPVPDVSQYDPLVFRGACYAYMGTVGNLALNPEGVALRNGQMLFAPLDNLTCWEVRANLGFILRVTPYYRALEPLEV